MIRRTLQTALLLLPLVLPAVTVREYLGFDPETEVDRAANAYFASENIILFRMRYPNGDYREFNRNFAHPNVLFAENGWAGLITDEEGVVITTGRDPNGDQWEWRFRSGRCVAFGKVGGKKRMFPYNAPRVAPGNEQQPNYYPYYYEPGDYVFDPDSAAGAKTGKKAGKGMRKGINKKVLKVLGAKWSKSQRLQWPFKNPNENGCLFALVALLSTALFFFKRRWVRIVGGCVFLSGATLLATTASRGSFLALFVGLLPIVALRARSVMKSKSVWVLAAIFCVAVAAWFGTHDIKLLTRGFSGKSSWSNQVRMEMWKTAPQMVVEAPDGWAFTNVGVGYFSWYQAFNEVMLPGSLMNEHLTRIVGYGWWGRIGYVLAWTLGLSLLMVAAWRTRNAVPLGVWSAFAVAGWFNPVFVNWTQWILPVGAIALFLCSRPWRILSFRSVMWTSMGAVLATAAILTSIYVMGSKTPARGYSIRAEKNRVYVKGTDPSIWIVDDGKALGGIFACRDIRGWYALRPESPSVGYVRDIGDLPSEKKIHRLVLAGDAGHVWLKWMAEGGPERQQNTPDEVVFISPPFSPSALPEGLLQSCKVAFLKGEFAARYDYDLGQGAPPWVVIITGMELYHPGWMEWVAGQASSRVRR